MKATLNRGQGGLYYTLVAEDGRELYYGTDWGYPSLARECGWDMKNAQRWPDETELAKAEFQPCDHEGTDGTIKCDECGMEPGEFISAAVDYLDEHDGEEFDVSDELAECFTAPAPE